jgi:outer membrane protein
MQNLFFKVLTAILSLAIIGTSLPCKAATPKRIGILVDGPYWHNTPIVDQIKIELKKLINEEYEIVFPPKYQFNAQYDLKTIRSYANKLVQNKELDAILSVGMISSFLFSEMKPLPIPVVAMDYILPAGLGMLAPKTFKPINPNWTTSFDPAYVDQTLKIFPKLIKTNRFVVFCPDVMCGLIPKVPKLIESFVGNPDIEVQVEVISPDNYQEAVSKLNDPLVIVETLKGFSDTQMEDLFKRLSDGKILAFTVDGLNGIKKGALVSIHDYAKERMGRNIALKLFDVLEDTPTSEIPVINYKTAELIFNRETALKIGYKIPLEFVDEAQIYGMEKQYSKLSFEDSIDRALSQNFDIKTQALIKDQALLQVKISERDFYPQVSSTLTHSRTNNDRADAQSSARSETQLGVSLAQKLYDRELWKTIEVDQATSKVEQQTLARVNQDIIEQVALAYMNVLQGEELVKVQREYLNIIRKNQNLADLKFKLRETGKSDVLRLNIELDNARIDLLDDKEDRFKSRVGLNNLLNLPLETRHQYAFDDFSEERHLSRAGRFNKYLSTADQLQVFRDFFDNQAQNQSPDLKELQTQLTQANVEKEKFISEFYPTLSLDAGYFKQVHDETKLLTASQEQNFENIFGEGWDFEFKLSFPLFLGGSRYKKVENSNVRILELESQINGRKNTLSEDARSGLFNVFRSRRNLEFSLRNVLSSRENLKLAEVSYLEGDLPVIDLLDSQSNLILSTTNAVRTRYQFYRDLFSLFRDVGRVCPKVS